MLTVYKCVIKRCLPWGVFLLLLFPSLCLTTPLTKKGRNAPDTSECFLYLRLEGHFKTILSVSLFSACWVFIAAQVFLELQCAEAALRRGAQASHGGGLFCCGVRALGRTAFSSCGTWTQSLQFPGSRAQAQ